MEFEVLILGTDANAYYMARCCHEAYHKKAYLIGTKGKAIMPYTEFSNILNMEYDNDIWTEEGFLKALNRFEKKHPDKKILLVSSNETYAEFISKNKKKISKNYVYNYPSVEIIQSLIMKDKFYQTYQDSILDFPKTYYYDCTKRDKIKEKFTYPIIVKPCNVIEYNHLRFEGKNKIYKLNNKKELEDTIDIITKNGYKSNLVIQEFIPGDDSCLFDSVVYADRNKKVKLVSFAQIGLQERTKAMVGNAAVLINGYSQYPGVKEMVEKIKTFMEEIGYQGFAEFDMKYDYRDKKFKVLEINARQGRCSYYITPIGANLIQILIDDLIYHKEMNYRFLNEKVLLSFVPKYVAKKYITNKEYKKEMLKLWKIGKVYNPIRYLKDRNINRWIFLFKRYVVYYKEYRHSYWKVD